MPQNELLSLTRCPSEMLNLANLAKHTKHHSQLDKDRDFVKEFLESLKPKKSAPKRGPKPAVTKPMDTNQGNLDRSRQQRQSHKSKRKRRSQESPEVPRPSINDVTAPTAPRRRHGASPAVVDGTKYRDNPRPTTEALETQGDPKAAKKRKQVLDVEFEIQQLDINQPSKTPTSARKRRGSRSTKPATGKKPYVALDGAPAL
ncbi:hypothetical protein EDD21DRAFT_108493 [Dissophora ornata]|nr:hypothetical protein EDD21DRAFT_108493 [Dissophora ornata]